MKNLSALKVASRARRRKLMRSPAELMLAPILVAGHSRKYLQARYTKRELRLLRKTARKQIKQINRELATKEGADWHALTR
jgi:hypothetical protein